MSFENSDLLLASVEVGALVASIWTFLVTNRLKREKADTEQLVNFERRFSLLEARLENAPDRDDLNRIHSRIDQVERTLHQLCGESQAMGRQLQLISETLMKD